MTGFVCFYDREYAEACFNALSDADAFGNGRRLMLSWGKNVLPDHARRQWATRRRGDRSNSYDDHYGGHQSHKNEQKTSSLLMVAASKSPAQIKVIVPSDKRRARFIALIAKFVAKDGSDLEDMLIQQHQQGLIRDNIDFLFSDKNREEHIFYKWRVYAYTQGDGDFRYRSQPFVMITGGCTWIPPPIDEEAARQEEDARRKEEESLRRQLQQKDMQRQRRQPRPKSTRTRPLSAEEVTEFHRLTRDKLCASRESIAAAMAFCFDKCSFAIDEVSNLLQELLLEREQVSVDSRIARLYLISDILFNSQQPGVKNAFAFRTKIEQAAPAIFQSLGEFARALPRMSTHKIQKAISSVLAAWTNWSVYNPAFLDELQDKFDGRQTTSKIVQSDPKEDRKETEGNDDLVTDDEPEAVADFAVTTAPSRNWREVDEEKESESQPLIEKMEAVPDGTNAASSTLQAESNKLSIGEAGEIDSDGMPLEEEDGDGEPLEEDADGEALDEESADGEPLNGGDDTDGEILEDDDPDGEPLD